MIKLMHHFLLRHVASEPHMDAIVGPKRTYNYAQLMAKTLEFNEVLTLIGLRHGDRVVCELSPTPEAIAMMIGCWMGGLVVVPTSPGWPAARRDEICRLSGARALIAGKPRSTERDLSGDLIHGLLSDNTLVFDKELSNPSGANPPLIDSDLAYIIFTSGTTGKPKGIMMSHRAAVSMFDILVNFFRLPKDARVGTLSPLCFDFSLLDLATALGSGRTLVQVPALMPHSPRDFCGFMRKHGVSQMNCVPAAWNTTLTRGLDHLKGLTSLKAIAYAGAAFPVDQMRIIHEHRPDIAIYNIFGHSESIACSFLNVPLPLSPEVERVPIAPAHANAEMLVLDEDGREISEPGKIGELYLRSPCLFFGYWKDPVATENALVLNPRRPETGERVFRTGDLVSRDDRGFFYFRGRADKEIKINGNRVSLEEVESTITTFTGNSICCAVVVQDQVGSDELVVFVDREGDAASDRRLRAECSERMPNYMIPRRVLRLQHFPTTTNGKYDYSALAKIAQEQR